MGDTILEIIKNSVLGKRFRNIGYLPRWIIFSIDVFIVLVATFISNFIIHSLSVYFRGPVDIQWRVLTIMLANAVSFLIYRTYAGIIRHSSFIDGVKLLVATTTAYLFLLILNYTTILVYGRQMFLTTGLFITYVISFLLLFLFRIMVKFFFEQYILVDDKNQAINAVIFGTDANAISVANALRTESPARFRVVGFVDKFNQTRTSRSILNIPIVNLNKKIQVILRGMKAEALIMAEKSLSRAETAAIVEECLEYNYKVFTVPLISDWEDQQQISKKLKSFHIEDLLDRKPIVLDTHAISNQLRNKTILISGAAGSIGSEIVRQVLAFDPLHIVLLDQAETPLHSLSLEIAEVKRDALVSNVLADIRDLAAMERVFDHFRPDVVYHAAAYKHVPLMEENPGQAVGTNVQGTKNLADLSARFNVDSFVMVSTDKAVNPSSVMGASKRIAEQYVRSLHEQNIQSGKTGTKFITTRFGNVLGSNGSIVPLFTKQIEEGGPLTITHPEIIRYFMTIPEACQLVLEAGAMGKGGEIFIFDMGEPVKIIDLAKKMIRLAGYVPDRDIEIKIIGLRPGEKLFEELLNDTSKTLPTHNEKIMIAIEMGHDHEACILRILDLLLAATHSSHAELVGKMKQIVPEFKSLNSIFQRLDV